MSFDGRFNHEFYPFKDLAEIERVSKITYEDIVAMNGKHPTAKNGTVQVVRGDFCGTLMMADIISRIVASDREDKKCVMILGNPNPMYEHIAYILRQMKVNMRNVKFYMMDEWVDEDGNIAPISYKAGFGYSFNKFMVSNIRDLGFKEENFIYHSNKTTPDYSKMLEQDGEADVMYSGPRLARTPCVYRPGRGLVQADYGRISRAGRKGCEPPPAHNRSKLTPRRFRTLR